MRSVLLPVFALAFASPAFAAPRAPDSDVQAMADKLNNPAMQAAMTDSLSAMMAAMMNIRLDGFAKALEPLNHGKKLNMHGRTLGEMAEREDPQFQAKMHDGTRAAVGSMGALASALAVMVPQLQEAARKMGEALPKTN